MEKIVYFVKEWFGGLVSWLYIGCLIFFAAGSSPFMKGQLQGVTLKIYIATMIFLFISFVVLLLVGFFMGLNTLVKEIPKEMKRISKELYDHSN